MAVLPKGQVHVVSLLQVAGGLVSLGLAVGQVVGAPTADNAAVTAGTAAATQAIRRETIGHRAGCRYSVLLSEGLRLLSQLTQI